MNVEERLNRIRNNAYGEQATAPSRDTAPGSYDSTARLNELRQMAIGNAAKRSEPTANLADLHNAKQTAAEFTPPDNGRKYRSADDPTFWQRAFNTGSGGVKNIGSGFANTAGTLADVAATSLQTVGDKQRSVNQETYQNNIDRWNEKLASAKTDKERARIERVLQNLEGNKKWIDSKSADGTNLAESAEKLHDVADKLSESAAVDIAEAKKDLGFGGRLAVDLGVGATQMAGDMLANIIAPGAGKVALATRVFGGSAQQARNEGASLGKQVTYGASQAALELALEGMSGGLSAIYGKGAMDDIIDEVIKKVTTSEAGRSALRLVSGMGGEALEEFLSGIISPSLDSIYNGKRIGENYSKETVTDALYDALVGGILGLVGKGGEEIRGGAIGRIAAQRNSAADTAESTANTTEASTETPAAERAEEAIVEGERVGAADAMADALVESVAPSAKQVNAIAKDPAALERLGIDPNGKTASQIRAEVREAIAQQAEAPAAQTPVQTTQETMQPSVKAAVDNVNANVEAGNTVGAAQQGFETPGRMGKERVSNINSGVAMFTRAESEATARNREDYDALFRYTTQTEAQSEQQAENLLYVENNGAKTFLMDYDADAYESIVKYLADAPAWNGVMTDAAMMIKHELQSKSIDGEISKDEYTSWLETMREHATETGRGTQAWAKWTRGDNRSGEATELEAWELLKNSDISKEQKRQIFDAIVRFDMRIESAQTAEELQNIVLEIAEQRRTVDGLTGKQSKLLHGIATKSLSGMTYPQLKQFAYASSAALAKDTNRVDIGSKLKTIQILNMLSNPKTAATNLAGNSTFYGLDALSMDGAALLDMALSKMTGTRSVAFESFALGKDGRGAVAEAVRLSLAEVTLDVDMGGSNRYQNDTGRTFKANGVGVFNTNTAADKFAERVFSVIERNTNYLMTTSDEAFKGAAKGTAKATQRLIDAGKIKTENQAYAEEMAEDLALYRTFQRDGKVSATLQGVHDILNILVGFGDSGKRIGKKGYTVHSFGLGDLVAPFTRVAANLAYVGTDYSPVNAVKGTAEIIGVIADSARGKTVDPSKQAKAVSDFARGMTGTAIALGVSLLAKAGLIRRAKDENEEDVAALNTSEGLVGTQVNIDAVKRLIGGGSAEWEYGDTLVDMSRLEPLNFILSLGVEMSDDEVDGILSFVGEPLRDTTASILETAGDLPVLSTIGDFVEDVKVYKTPVLEAAAQSLGKTAISSVTPNIVAAFAKGIDDKQRNVYGTDSEGIAGVGDVLLNTLLSRTPIARESLPTTVNSLGEEKANNGTLVERLLAAMLSPIGVNEYTQSEVSKEMERVREETGKTDFYPENRKPSSVSYTDKSGVKHEVELTYDQKQKFQSVRGDTHMAVSGEMVKNKHYQSANVAEQAALLDRARDYAFEVAKMSVLGADSGAAWAKNSQTARRDLGISQTDFLYYYEKYGSDLFANGDNYNKTKRMVSAGLSIDQWEKMRKNVGDKKSDVERYIEANFPRNKWSAIFDAYKGSRNWKNDYK